MKRWQRKLRGIAGTGAIRGAAGIALGAVAAPFFSVFGGVSLLQAFLQIGLNGLAGFVLGSGFATVLTTLEGRSTLDELTPRRAAVCGAMAGAAYPLVVLPVYLLMGGVIPPLPAGAWLPLLISASWTYGLLTAGLAAGTLALARKAPGELGSGRQTDGIELLGEVSEG